VRDGKAMPCHGASSSGNASGVGTGQRAEGQGQHRDAVLLQRPGLGEARFAVDAAGRGVALVHGAGGGGEIAADIVGTRLELALHGEQRRQHLGRIGRLGWRRGSRGGIAGGSVRPAVALGGHSRRHHGLADLAAAAQRAGDEAARVLALVIRRGAEPRLEDMRPGAAQIENNHAAPMEKGRALASAGMRPRASATAARSIRSSAVPGASPMSSSTSPQGEMTSEWP